MNNQSQHITSPLSLIKADENSERLIIGTLLTVPNAMMNLCDNFKSDYFYNDFYKDIFEAISYLDTESKKIDVLTVSDIMRKKGIDVDMLAMMKVCESYSYDIEPHSLIVKEKAIERSLILLIHQTTLKMQENEDINDILFSESEGIAMLQEDLTGSQQSEHISIAVTESLDELNHRCENFKNGLIAGIPTGLTDLDKWTGGWQNQDLVIIAGRPGMGKTSTVLTFAQSAAEFGKSIAIFSLEMGKRQLTDKMIIGESGINAETYKIGNIPGAQRLSLSSAVDKISHLPIYIDDKPGISVSYLRARCRLLKKQGKCDMVIIDYLQLMSGDRRHGENREREVASISGGCKAIAKELDIPVILLSQLNRKSEDRAGNRPMMQDLRESGAIEQDADQIFFIHRPEKYGLEFKDQYENVHKNGMEIICAKFRNGSTGTLYAIHNDSMSKLYDLNSNRIREDTFDRDTGRFYEPKENTNDLPF